MTTTADFDRTMRRVSEPALDVLFREARTFKTWLPVPVPAEVLREAYELARLAPTAANCNPARFLFLTTDAAKGRLLPALKPGNLEQTRTAPVTVIVASDLDFMQHRPVLLPHLPPAPAGAPAPDARLVLETAHRNGTLQGAYFMLAARALGLDCGPMSGFDADAVNAEFFPDGRWTVNFLCNLGYGDRQTLRPRLPRLDVDIACRFL